MKRYVPDGMPKSLTYPEGPLGAVLAGSARRYADRIALRDGELTFTYGELYDSALRIARALRERGVRRGETVALHQPNSAWFTVTYFGILLAGTVAVFTHPSTRATLTRPRSRACG
ncbi:AMP-binding protein [Streptomyces sp. NPDC059904]|uniref:AMP-binding protein n=1 Tax=Streptomyces sp. NPDC059904 TaxID=3346996 RepID=UPI00365DDA71